MPNDVSNPEVAGAETYTFEEAKAIVKTVETVINEKDIEAVANGFTRGCRRPLRRLSRTARSGRHPRLHGDTLGAPAGLSTAQDLARGDGQRLRRHLGG